MSAAPSLSVIIPAFNEADALRRHLGPLAAEAAAAGAEVIVACNGCTDDSAEVARAFPVAVAESERAGMGYGKNLGAVRARGELLVFVDADTVLAPGALAEIRRAAGAVSNSVGTLPGRLESATTFEKIVMRLANRAQAWRRLPAPSGVIFLSHDLFRKIGGFDESLPQATSSDLALRAQAAGGEWIFLRSVCAITSPRRFRKVGILRQMFSWIRNVRLLRRRAIGKLTQRPYEPIR